jgi:predicted helicase
LLALLNQSDLTYSYQNLLHANEIVLLAYYVAAVNIEQTYHSLRGEGLYEPFCGIVLTDTFQLGEGTGEMPSEFLRPNSERARNQQALPITVVLGNPPYSVGQRSENDNNKNLSYPKLDNRIAHTYVAKSSAAGKRNLYDSYIRAFRWATDRIGERGIVCYVTNGSFIDSVSADGFRKTLSEEFSKICCLNLRGNARTSGEQWQKEGGKVFGQGSRTPVAITLLVKNPYHSGPARIFYHDIGDYLSREEKLARLQEFQDVTHVPWQEIAPNDYGDWINQRSELFITFTPLGNKHDAEGDAVFSTYSCGVNTARDAWTYNFSRQALLTNMQRTIDFYNSERERFQEALKAGKLRPSNTAVDNFVNTDATKVSWTLDLKRDLKNNKEAKFFEDRAVISMYRPFCKQWLYFDRQWNNSVFLIPSLFPTPAHENKVILVSATGDRRGFSALACDAVSNYDIFDKSQCFPRYFYTKTNSQGSLFDPNGNSYECHDGISPRTLERYRDRYGNNVSADDVFYYVYGLLHSPDYRSQFAAELRKMIPRIPMVEDFWDFVEAGKKLANLHLNYETVEPWPLEGLPDEGADPETLRVKKMRFKSKEDRSAIVVNNFVTLSGIPEDAYRYQVSGRSALEWILDRYRVDEASGIKNDPNTWSENPHYIVDLVARIVRVSLESVEIIDKLPALKL